MNNEVMIKLAELLEQAPLESTKVDLNSVELLPNTFASIIIDRPIFLENVLYSTAVDTDIALLKEKKLALEPEDMIEKAHPKSIYVSNALGDGGLVENQNEQHAKHVQMVNKLPTGSIVHIHANLIQELVKVANELEDAYPDLAHEIDDVLASLAVDSKKKLDKQAGWGTPWFLRAPALIAGIIALLSSGGAAVAAIRGKQENIVVDSQQLLDILRPLSVKYPQSAQNIREMISAVSNFNSISKSLLAATDNKISNLEEVQEISNQLAEEDSLLMTAEQAFAQVRGREGLDPILTQSIEGHFADLKGSLENFKSTLSSVGTQVQEARNRSSLPGAEDIDNIGSTPIPVVPSTRSPEDRQKVLEFLNETYQPGITNSSLDKKLYEIAARLTRDLGVSNITGERLLSANVIQLRNLFELAQNPAAAAGYTTDLSELAKYKPSAV